MKLSDIVKMCAKVSQDFGGKDVEIRSLLISEDGKVILEVLSDNPPEDVGYNEFKDIKRGVLN